MDQRPPVLKLREQHGSTRLAGHPIHHDVGSHPTEDPTDRRSAFRTGGDHHVADHVVDDIDQLRIACCHPAGRLAARVKSGDPPRQCRADGIAGEAERGIPRSRMASPIRIRPIDGIGKMSIASCPALALNAATAG